MFLKRIFQGFWPQVNSTYFVEHLSMVAYDNTLSEKQYVIFQQILIPLEKCYNHLRRSKFIKPYWEESALDLWQSQSYCLYDLAGVETFNVAFASTAFFVLLR